MKTGRSSLTEGPIWKSIVLFALPILLGNVFQQLYNTFDSWCVGNFIGEDALAAVSSSGTHGHAVEKAHQHEDQTAGGADRRQGILTDEIAYAPGIKGLI